MTDVYTVMFSSTMCDTIPWTLSFGDLDLAKNHVMEEAAKHAADLEAPPAVKWDDYEDYSILIQAYDPDRRDEWLVVRTELVETEPSTELTTL